ncbi:targeted glyoxalase II, putative (tGloII) [Plasmodium ovale curtisi]|uniref:hydroxyacylglutathione hydrolase n=1 Tax=Plasmodium ovale curtisi TaxID=864141 RepID=A0A1A8WWJ0_PLAOA|nr:targeted glyoxalase II, putative (tGloII) [Plasmodium ovale curtisi]
MSMNRMKITKALFTLSCITYTNGKHLSICRKLFFENDYFKRSITYSTHIRNGKKYFILRGNYFNTNVIVVPIYKDNYSYIFYNEKDDGIAVDPSDHKEIMDICEKENIQIKHVLCTHKHADHNSGNFFFYDKKINVYGIKEGNNRYINRNIEHVSNFEVSNFKITTHLSNFHCTNHIAYLIENCKKNNEKKIFFTGDFLFICGIGKNFEGKNKDMFNAIKALKEMDKKNTYIFCGHEYTRSNIQFALSIDQSNNHLTDFYERLLKIEQDIPTVPSTLEEEFLYNPFLRYNEDNIRQAIRTYAKRNNYVISENIDYLVLLRRMKDNFQNGSYL